MLPGQGTLDHAGVPPDDEAEEDALERGGLAHVRAADPLARLRRALVADDAEHLWGAPHGTRYVRHARGWYATAYVPWRTSCPPQVRTAQEAGTRTPYGGPRTYVSARPSTSRRSVASPQRGRPPAAGRDTRICSEAGVELAGLGGDELPRCCRYLAEQRVGRSPRRRYFSRSRQWGIAFAAQLFSWRQTRKSASSDTQNLDFGLS